ncbi:MAG: pyridoxal-phosphate dependent enzyme [Candidatus Heimdallarchaeota archaeon]|nr:pyridoxal-phosphate dependent enzyme [Candidatus Heimdallarchaeota archaeon]
MNQYHVLDRLEVAFERVKAYANKTPVMSSRSLNEELESIVYFKCENLQRGGAFKFRGALNAISQLSDEEKRVGVIAHSSGNHAQAVALVGKLLNIKTVIVMPENAPMVKVNATRGYGAEVHFCTPTIEAREIVCNDLISKHGYTLVHPFDNQHIIEGASTAVQELVQEVGELDLVISPIGGGGLISGTSLYAKLSSKIGRVIGAEPEGADDAYQSFTNKNRVTSHVPSTICDGLLTVLSELTFSYISEHVDDIITVSEEEIVAAMHYIWERMKLIVEPSSAVVLAALRKGIAQGLIPKGLKVGLIISGGNSDLTSFFDNIRTKI